MNFKPVMSLIKNARAAVLRRPKYLLAVLVILTVTGVGCLSAFSGTKATTGNTLAYSIAPQRVEDFQPRLGTYFYSASACRMCKSASHHGFD